MKVKDALYHVRLITQGLTFASCETVQETHHPDSGYTPSELEGQEPLFCSANEFSFFYSSMHKTHMSSLLLLVLDQFLKHHLTGICLSVCEVSRSSQYHILQEFPIDTPYVYVYVRALSQRESL